MLCDLCHEQTVELLRGGSEQVSGWTQPRSEGGVHHLIGRKELGRYACATCTKKMRDGVHVGQATLL